MQDGYPIFIRGYNVYGSPPQGLLFAQRFAYNLYYKIRHTSFFFFTLYFKIIVFFNVHLIILFETPWLYL